MSACSTCGGSGSIAVPVGEFGIHREACWKCGGSGALEDPDVLAGSLVGDMEEMDLAVWSFHRIYPVPYALPPNLRLATVFASRVAIQVGMVER